MGYLRDWNLLSFGCNVYVETGTGLGVSLGKAYSVFNKCFSVDLDPEMVDTALLKFPNAHIEVGESTFILEKWLKSDFLQPNDSVLFYLDAHFPGADFKGAEYNVNAPNAVPLQHELQLIKKYRPNSNDIIICDDARIYTTGPFENGNVNWLQVPGGLDFIKDLFPSSAISIHFAEEGYILINMKSSSFDSHFITKK
jgi:hypothetical protein